MAESSLSNENRFTTSQPVAIVTGGSSGLGLEIAIVLAAAHYRVVVVGRDQDRLQQAQQIIGTKVPSATILLHQADLAQSDAADAMVTSVISHWGRCDLLVNNIGLSDRGWVENLTADRLMEVITANIIPTLNASRAALPHLAASQGVIVNIGSMAAKVGARYLGAYPAAKHALAGLTQQMRLEWKPRGVHVALINPGPIRREDAGSRYAQRVAEDGSPLPDQANLPGGGTKLKGLDPTKVARTVLRMARRRQADVIMPTHLRPLVAIGHLWPALGDWILLKFTSVKREDN